MRETATQFTARILGLIAPVRPTDEPFCWLCAGDLGGQGVAHGALSIEIEGQEPIEVHYEEWLDELRNGVDSRWRTGISQDWNKMMPKVSEDAVDEIHWAVENSVYRRLRGSGWRTHL